jgi:hypothetical protein
MSKFLLLYVALTFSIYAFAGDRDRPLRPGHRNQRGNENSERVTSLTVGDPSYGGNGCPAGAMRAVFAPDNLSFTMIFDQFVAEVATDQKMKRDVMNCDALIPMQIPAGMQMEITRVDFRGFIGLPAGTRAALHSVFNFRGPGGDKDRINLHFDFQGPVMDNYELSSDATTGAPTEVSPCGGNVRLRIMNQLKVVSPKREAASATLDSVDGSSHAIYYVNWKTCK